MMLNAEPRLSPVKFKFLQLEVTKLQHETRLTQGTGSNLSYPIFLLCPAHIFPRVFLCTYEHDPASPRGN
jgi:hypothetical protein